MKGIRIIVHSFLMIVRNFGQALRIGLVPFLVLCALSIGIFVLAAILSPQSFYNDGNPLGFVVGLALITLWITLFVWFAVAWHRLILLEEYTTGWIPNFKAGRVLYYFSTIVLITVVTALAMMALIAVVSATISGLGIRQIGLPNAGFVLFSAGVLAFLYFVLRISLILPAAALGEPLSIRDSLRATKGDHVTFVVVGLFAGVLRYALEFVDSDAFELPIWVYFAALPLSGFFMFWNVSILTTLYGHYVEGRAIK